MKAHELKKLLCEHGCYLEEEGANHEKWRSTITGNLFVVTRDSKHEIPAGTLGKILKLAGVKKPR